MYLIKKKKAVNIRSVFHVIMFNLLFYSLKEIFFFLIGNLNCPKLCCYTGFLVKYLDSIIFLQMSASDLLQASFQLTVSDF